MKHTGEEALQEITIWCKPSSIEGQGARTRSKGMTSSKRKVRMTIRIKASVVSLFSLSNAPPREAVQGPLLGAFKTRLGKGLEKTVGSRLALAMGDD